MWTKQQKNVEEAAEDVDEAAEDVDEAADDVNEAAERKSPTRQGSPEVWDLVIAKLLWQS